MLLLVNTSTSMQRDNLWADAVAQSQAVLQKLGTYDRIALCAFDRRLRTIVEFDEASQLDPLSRQATLDGRLQELRPTWQATDLGVAPIAAAQATRDDAAQHSERLTGGPAPTGRIPASRSMAFAFRRSQLAAQTWLVNHW